MMSLTVRTYVRPTLNVCQCDQYHASLQHTSLILDIHVFINWHLSKQGVRWPLSRDHIAGSRLALTEFSCLFLSWPLTRYWFSIGLQAQPRLTHLNKNEASFFASFLWLDAATRPYYINYSSYTVNAFRVKTVWKMFSLSIFCWFQFCLTYHDICDPLWWPRTFLSQATEGYKLKAECLFLICLELLFSLYCNFWHIFRSSDKVTWCLKDLCLERKRKERAKENDNDKTEYQ